MRVPLGWLREYVDFDDTAAGLADRLTFSGIEVEGIETVGSDFAGVVAARVERVERHPQADRLTLCTVDDGRAPRTVVCGAPDVRAGGVYALALPGAVLPNGLSIRSAKVRGVVSDGMLCAEDELGLSEDHSGLLPLPDAVAPGTPLAAAIGGAETVLDLEITPNRPDCLCLIGIAREVSALYGRPLRRPDPGLAEGGGDIAGLPAVEIEDPARCPRYVARVVQGVRPGPSPLWLRRRLRQAGVRPVSNVVDVTNYVMLECGQPLHAFDGARLAGRRIMVRGARPDEILRTLDGAERRLTPDMLVIADGDGAVAIAGVMGGARSEIGDGTADVVLESAAFQPSNIRRTARALGLTTESSYRFSRGVDAEGADWASRRAAAMIARLAGGAVAGGSIDRRTAPAPRRDVSCRWSALRDRLDVDARPDEVLAILRALELEPVARDADGFRVRVPGFRTDLAIEEDLVEEYARIAGLDRIPLRPPSVRVVSARGDGRAARRRALRAELVALGLQEIVNYSLVSRRMLDRFALDGPGERIALPRPLSEDQSILRTSLVPQLVETLGRNRSRQVEEAAVFELGRVYRSAGPRESAEEERLAIGLMGRCGAGRRQKRAEATPLESFLWLKGLVAKLLERRSSGAMEVEPRANGACEPGTAVRIRAGGEDWGWIGILDRRIAADWRIHTPVAVAELAADLALKDRPRPPSPAAPPAFPSSSRDIALVVDKSIRHADIVGVAPDVAPPELSGIELFDVYEGKAIPAGRRSMAYSLVYRAPDRTLTDDEVNAAHQRISDALCERLKAEIRSS